jgi:hypothetical protein
MCKSQTLKFITVIDHYTKKVTKLVCQTCRDFKKVLKEERVTYMAQEEANLIAKTEEDPFQILRVRQPRFPRDILLVPHNFSRAER